MWDECWRAKKKNLKLWAANNIQRLSSQRNSSFSCINRVYFMEILNTHKTITKTVNDLKINLFQNNAHYKSKKSITKVFCFWIILLFDTNDILNQDNLSEWLRRKTRNLLGLPAQVRILQLSFFTEMVLWEKELSASECKYGVLI